MSSSAISGGSESPLKRRRTSSSDLTHNNSSQDSAPIVQLSQSHIPKRGARACTSCRKGKNRCEGEPPCRRCMLSGTPCVFEKPERKTTQILSGPSVERLSRLEDQCMVMQSQMIGMQSSLDRILSAVQMQTHGGISQQGSPSSSNIGQGIPRETPVYVPLLRNNFEAAAERRLLPSPSIGPPLDKCSTYGVDPNPTLLSEDESDDTLPRPTMNPPIEALQGLANAAVEAAAVHSLSPTRVKKRKHGEPIIRGALPHGVEKGLVSESVARELYHIFFAGCHLFMPLFDPSYDTYESLISRTPWTFNAILAVAAKVKSGNGSLNPMFFKFLEEARGIAESSLFSQVVQKEAVQGMLLLAAWSANPWLPSGHAMRMALDLGLHRALGQLAQDSGKQRTEEQERDLVISARIWLCLYWFDHQISLRTGRPIVLREEGYVKHCRLLLTHPMTSPTDVRLIAQVELITQKAQIYETLSTSNGQVNHNTLAFIRRANIALDNWWADCDEFHGKTMDEDSLLRRVLAGELHYTKLWLVCIALRGVSWDKMPFEQRELAFQAKDSAFACLSIFLASSPYRAALRYATHDGLVQVAFSGLFLLKMANLFPAELDSGAIIAQTEQLVQLLSDISAERYALAIRIMLAHLRRKAGLNGGMGGSSVLAPGMADGMIITSPLGNPGPEPPPFTMEELGFTWRDGRETLDPSSIVSWLQEQNLADLGFPDNGFDGIFAQLPSDNNWMGDLAPLLEVW